MQAKLIQLSSPIKGSGSAREWSIVNPHLHGLPLSQALLDNTPANINMSTSDLTRSLTKLLAEGYWSGWELYAVKVFVVMLDSKSDAESGSQTADVILVKAQTSGDSNTYSPSESDTGRGEDVDHNGWIPYHRFARRP